MRWFLKALHQYFDFTGRARRKEFWMYLLIATIISIALALLDLAFGLTPEGRINGGPINQIYQLLVFIPTIAVGARRLHDIGRSGWWQLVGLIPFVLLGIGVATSAPPLLSIALVVLVVTIGVFAWLIVWLATPGKPEHNKWGANPKQGGPAAYIR